MVDKDKELITKVTLSSGTVMCIYMPEFGEVHDKVSQGVTPTVALLECATGIEWDELRRLPVMDGYAILQVVAHATEALQKYIGRPLQ